jgi:hypothetical protein
VGLYKTRISLQLIRWMNRSCRGIFSYPLRGLTRTDYILYSVIDKNREITGIGHNTLPWCLGVGEDDRKQNSTFLDA